MEELEEKKHPYKEKRDKRHRAQEAVIRFVFKAI
jgi:hypothetical protein